MLSPDLHARPLCQRVEAALLDRADATPQSPEHTATRSLLHELQVHQTELQAQNEELRRAQNERDTAQARFFELYDLAPVGYCTVRETGELIEANLTFAALLGVVRAALAGRPFYRHILPADQDTFYLLHKRLFASEWTAGGPPLTCEALAQFGSWYWHLADGQSTWSDKLFEIYGRDKAQGVPAFGAWEETIHPDDRDKLAQCIQQALASESRYSVEFRICAKDTGALRYISSRGVSKVDGQGRVVGIWGVDQDITVGKLAAQALEASVREKEALLREVHHRVKNNLQVITSLLRLESYRSKQPDTRAVLEEMQGRIRTMAVLHESLYQSSTFASVDLGAYLGKLVTQLFRAHTMPDATVRLQLDLASVQVAMEQATPCGLIANELASNCLKHGFPAGHSGEVRVALRAMADTAWLQLSVSDTGVGLPADFETRRGQSLGLQLVSDLVGQIDGRLEVGPGTSFTVTFERTQPGPRSLED